MGLYVLTEKVGMGKGRVEIPETQGKQTAYFLAIDRVKDRKYVTTRGGLQVVVDFPKGKALTAARKQALVDTLNDIEDRLKAPGSPGYQRLFTERIDLESAVDFFIIQELTRNVDAYRLSSPMYIAGRQIALRAGVGFQ
jgi:hypothetical protein